MRNNIDFELMCFGEVPFLSMLLEDHLLCLFINNIVK